MRYFLTTTALAGLGLTALTADVRAQEVIRLDDIVISANATPVEADRTGAQVEVLTEEDLQNATTPLVADALESLPGVSVDKSGPAGTLAAVRVRGARESLLAVYVDGIKVNDPSTTEGQFANFGSLGVSNVSRVELLKGGQSALYGGSAVAGVVNVLTLPLDTAVEGTSQTAEVMVGTYDTALGSYSIVQKTGPLTLGFGMSRLRSDGFSAADENAGNTEADSYQETTMNFGLRYAASDTVTLGFNAFVSRADAEFDEFGPGDGTPGDETSYRDSEGLRAFAIFQAGAWEHEVALSRFHVDRGLSSVTAFGGFTSQFDAKRTRFEYQAAGAVSDVLDLAFGFDVQEEEVTATSIAAGSQTVRTRGAFGELNYAVSSDLDVTATMRVDDHSSFGTEWTGRLAAAWRPMEGLTVRASASTGYRAPALGELFAFFPGAFPYLGNPNLTPETSESLEIGADYRFANDATLGFVLFRTDVNDRITFQSCPLNGTFTACAPGTNSTVVNVAGTSTLQGLELDGSYPVSENVTLTGGYTYTDATDPTGAQLIRVPEHSLSLGLDAQITPDLNLGLNLQHVAGRAAEGTPAVVPADYTVVDATVTYAVTDTAEAYLRIDNLFDKEYQTVPGFGTSDRAAYFGIRASF